MKSAKAETAPRVTLMTCVEFYAPTRGRVGFSDQGGQLLRGLARNHACGTLQCLLERNFYRARRFLATAGNTNGKAAAGVIDGGRIKEAGPVVTFAKPKTARGIVKTDESPPATCRARVRILFVEAEGSGKELGGLLGDLVARALAGVTAGERGL